MIQYCLAYRHDNGDVEGFKAYAFGADAAREQAIEQIRRKLKIVGSTYDPKFLIESDNGLTTQEKKDIKSDWSSNLRYGPNGEPEIGGNAGPGQSGLS